LNIIHEKNQRNPANRPHEMEEMIMADVRSEFRAMLQLCTALNCDNVQTFHVEPSRTRRAMKRKKSKKHHKRELFDYHVLDIMVPGVRNVYMNSEDDKRFRRSPRLHLRRGHMRRLPHSEERTWVKPSLVGKKESGAIQKDYRVHT
jgi:hypothetical protein